MSLELLARRVLEAALKSPYDAQSLLAQSGIPIDQLRPIVRSLEVPHQRLWTSLLEQVVRDTSNELIRIYKDKATDKSDPFDLYLYMNNSRILNLITALKQIKASGTVMEIGSLAGSFALALQRSGYQVTAVDRYELMTGIYEPNIA